MRDRFVARRGSQGDNWHWEGDGAPGKQLPVAKVTRTPAASARHAASRVTTPVVSGFAAVGAAAQRSFNAISHIVRETFRRDRAPGLPESPQIETPSPPVAPPAPEPVMRSAEPAGVPAVTRRPLLERMRGLNLPKVPRPALPKMPRPALPKMLRARLQRPALRMKVPEISEDMRAPLTLFTALGLAGVLAVAIAIGVTLLDDNGSNGSLVAGAIETPAPTREPTPSDDTPAPTGPAATATPAPVTPPPLTPPVQGPVSAALWSNVLGQWSYGDLARENGEYSRGDFLPVLANFAATPGQTYDVQVTYDCAIDYLSGIDAWGPALLLANGGPGRDRPDAAIPVPDTQDFAADDGAFGIIELFGGRFAGLPGSPQPTGDCAGQRTLGLRVTADSELLMLVLSGHIAATDDPFGVEVSVAGVGSVRVRVSR